MCSRLPRVRLQRDVELPAPRLTLFDWPGLLGPVVHVPDLLAPDLRLVESLAAALAPDYRVVSLQPRSPARGAGYQLHAADVLATLDQFGFERPVLLGQRLGALVATLVAAWAPGRPAGLVLVDPLVAVEAASDMPGPPLEVCALRDCPPDWLALGRRVACPVLMLASHGLLDDRLNDALPSARTATLSVDAVHTFLERLQRSC